MATKTMVYAYTKSEARKLPEAKKKPPSLFDEKVSLRNWYRFVNWPQSILLLGTPLIALYGMATTELQTKTLLWSILYYFITGLCITGGKQSIIIQYNLVTHTHTHPFFQATIDCLHTDLMWLRPLSKSTFVAWEVVLLKDPSIGGQEVTVLITGREKRIKSKVMVALIFTGLC
jgi:hypothetical protein